jgi:prepilin-type N-terminal cleavage/methylation domain-containing protein
MVTLRLQRLVREERGFSLIEMLAALAILLTIVGTLTTLMVSATKSEVDLTERVRAQQEARLALEAMRRDVHCASAITASSSSVTLTLPTGCPSANSGNDYTWCASGTASRFVLNRIAAATCDLASSTRRETADYLIQSNLFTLIEQSGKLDKLCVYFPVDTDPTDTRRVYRLKDELVLRNSARNTSGSGTCP